MSTLKGNLLPIFCKEGTILGLKYFYLFPDKPSRCFWCAFLSLVLYFAVLLAYLLYRRFEAMPTRITIENQFEPVAPLPFPAVTLCSPNQMTLSAVHHFEETLVNGDREGLNLSVVLPQLLGLYYFIKMDQPSLTILQRLVDLNRYTVPEVMALLSQSCEDFMRACVFRKQVYPRCQGLFRPILTKHGMCCIFNSVYHYRNNRRNERDHEFRPHLVGVTGVQDGLSVITDYQPHDAVDHTINFAGATRVMFTDWTEFPTDDESLLVPPYTESFHFIHATATYCSDDVKALKPSVRKCSFEEEQTLPFFWRYRNSDCDLLCLVRAVEDRCKCLMIYLPQLRLTQACLFTHLQCITDTKIKLNDWLDKEKCECPRDCDARYYRVDVTVGNLRALQYMYYPVLNVHNVNQSTSFMHFFFHTPVYERQKQETVMSYTTLASNLGGVFGLCMGVSVISVLEMCFFQYVRARNCLRRHRRPPRRHPQAPSPAPSPPGSGHFYYYE